MVAAAFYDLEGTLVSTNLVHALYFYSKNQQGLWQSAVKTVSTVASIPLFWATDLYSRKVFNDLFFKRYAGESEDRLKFLSKELFEKVLRPNVFPGAKELISKSRSLGLRQVVVTGAIDLMIKDLMEYLEVDDFVANRLEFVNGRATGRLLPPVMASATKAMWIRQYAEREGINLNDSYAYTDSMSDLPMLSVVGHPAVVNPDVRLRATAVHHDWPILTSDRETMPQLRRKIDEAIVYIDTDSAPRIIPYGEDFWLEDLPVGTRVIYPKPPIQGLPNREAAIRYALNHPHDCDPLYAQLRPGMKITVALDDISLPLPPMKTPDVRQTILEILLEMFEANGIDDVHLIIANSLHRKMTPDEMKRMVGPKIFKEFYPDRYYNHDAEWPEGMVYIGTTEHGEVLNINRRAAESDLLIYVNINLVPMDGGHKSVAVGLCDYESLRAHHEPQTILDSHSYMDPAASALNTKCVRLGRLVDKHMNVFHIETALNNRMYDGPMSFMAKKEDDFTATDRAKFEAMRFALKNLPWAARRKIFHSVPAAYELIACHAGKTEPTHDRILAKCFEQYAIPVKGQADIMICGIPHISPYNVNSILNPLLVQVMGLGYFFNMFRYKPILKKGGVLILCHPCYDEFDHEHHPSYIEFFHRLLPETRDAFRLRHKYEREFASNPSYIQMYRRGNAYHGAHPFFMWYWGENGRAHVGKVIVAGAENAHVPQILGWERADNLQEAIAMAKGYVGRSAEITMLHQPSIIIADVE